jgi:hypothetical protein
LALCSFFGQKKPTAPEPDGETLPDFTYAAHSSFQTRDPLIHGSRYIYSSQDDRAFIMTMGIDVETFHHILDCGFAKAWNTTPIPRGDTSSSGNPRLGRCSLDAAGALGLTMYFLGSAMLETSLQQIFALIPSTVSRYLRFSWRLLLASLRHMDDAAISLPRDEEEYAALNSLIVNRHSRLTGAFGSVNGLSLAVMEADDPEVENATYNGWKSSHVINNVIVFSPRGASFPFLKQSHIDASHNRYYSHMRAQRARLLARLARCTAYL